MNTSVFSVKIGNFRLTEADGMVIRLEYTQQPEGEPVTDLARTVQRQLQEYCTGTRKAFDFPYELRGTEFQRAVWQALEKIPYGETRTYKEIAADMGNPKACRAVGGAIHRNPILIAVPCHRVVGADGGLTGFAAGTELKEILLRLEGWNKNG